jgi:outer membrane protein
LDLGVIYGSEKYHDYHYSVPLPLATNERPAYEAESGYSGTYLSISMAKRGDSFWYGGYLRYDNLRGATFSDSPLVETDHYFALGLGVSWIIKRSRSVVPIR